MEGEVKKIIGNGAGSSVLHLSILTESWIRGKCVGCMNNCGNFTADFRQLGFCISPLSFDFGTLISKWNDEYILICKEDFGSFSDKPVHFLLSPSKKLLSLVQESLSTSKAMVVAYMYISQSPCLMNLHWTPFKVLHHNLCKAVVIAFFLHSIFYHTFSFHLNFLLCLERTWNDLLRLILLIEGVNNYLLDNCQVIHLPHNDCVYNNIYYMTWHFFI